MIGGSACHSIHMATDVFVARLGIVFFELKVFFDCHGSPILYRHGSLVPLLPCVMCRLDNFSRSALL